MKVYIAAFFVLATTLFFSGCDYYGFDSPRGFSLPVGDANSGKEALLYYNCLDCHSLEGLEDPFMFPSLEVSVQLGGSVTKTYGDLVTSIINPSHRLSKGYEASLIADGETSKMTNYNDAMTVKELIDIVTFLQPHYELEEYWPTTYPPYY